MIGRKLNNRYEIREHLGDGSTSTVYKGFDLTLQRDVAVKMLLPHVRDTTVQRFMQEATAAAQLNHANIMSIYDMGEDRDRPYLIIEFVDGSPLSDFIPSLPDVIIGLGVQIAGALQYAHDHNVIHRDIKPANINVTPEGIVKIMDLGLALPGKAKRVTAHGMVIGTPAYLSPEQAQGHELDHRTDIYSLGIVLYEMATGQLPFNADDISALLLQQVRQPPPPPRLIVEDLPAGLESVILKALEKDPTRRFQSCNAMAAALEGALPPRTDVTPDTPTTPNRPAWADTLQMPRSGASPTRMKPTLRVMIADDHAILRRTLVSFLETRDDFVVVEEASDGESALQKALAVIPDVLILDINMPGKTGLDILPELRSRAPQIKVLVLTGREEEAYIVRALKLGAHGYILKSSEEDDLVDGILKVMDGQLVLGRGVAEKIVVDLMADSSQNREKPTDTEAKILLHIAAGHSNDAIAAELEMSRPVFIEALARLMDKMQVRDRHAAALKALRYGYILLEDLHNMPASDETV